MQQELFGPPPSPPLSTLDTSPLDGLRLKLERKIDHKKGLLQEFRNRSRGQGTACGGAEMRRMWKASRMVTALHRELVTNDVGVLPRGQERRAHD